MLGATLIFVSGTNALITKTKLDNNEYSQWLIEHQTRIKKAHNALEIGRDFSEHWADTHNYTGAQIHSRFQKSGICVKNVDTSNMPINEKFQTLLAAGHLFVKRTCPHDPILTIRDHRHYLIDLHTKEIWTRTRYSPWEPLTDTHTERNTYREFTSKIWEELENDPTGISSFNQLIQNKEELLHLEQPELIFGLIKDTLYYSQKYDLPPEIIRVLIEILNTKIPIDKFIFQDINKQKEFEIEILRTINENCANNTILELYSLGILNPYFEHWRFHGVLPHINEDCQRQIIEQLAQQESETIKAQMIQALDNKQNIFKEYEPKNKKFISWYRNMVFELTYENPKHPKINWAEKYLNLT